MTVTMLLVRAVVVAGVVVAALLIVQHAPLMLAQLLSPRPSQLPGRIFA